MGSFEVGDHQRPGSKVKDCCNILWRVCESCWSLGIHCVTSLFLSFWLLGMERIMFGLGTLACNE